MSTVPGDYIHFKSQVPLRRVSVGLKQWRYYDYGPKEVPPLICLPGVQGTADVFYKQIMFLAIRGYRVIAADAPPIWNHQEWLISFEKFLDTIDIHHVHLYGTELGGFMAQLFAQYRPRRVKSLVLSNTFIETKFFAEKTPWSTLINWTPAFMLKRFILTGIPNEPQDPFIADAVDFIVSQLETLEREDLASRMILKTKQTSVGKLLLPDSAVTIMDTNDRCTVPQLLKNQLSDRYPGAREALLKSGGDFPFLSRPDEINLHLQLHLRRVGVEAKPDDIISDPSQGDSSGNPAAGNEESEDDVPENNESPSHLEENSTSSKNDESTNQLSGSDGDDSGINEERKEETVKLQSMYFLDQYHIILYLYSCIFSAIVTELQRYGVIDILLQKCSSTGFS